MVLESVIGVAAGNAEPVLKEIATGLTKIAVTGRIRNDRDARLNPIGSYSKNNTMSTMIQIYFYS